MTSTKLVVILASLFAFLNITSGSIPSVPRNLTIDGIGSRSINISWTRPAEGGNSSQPCQLCYAVFYKAKGQSVLQLVELENVNKATLVVKPYRVYEIFVMAKNNDGYGPPSVTSHLTLEEEPEMCPLSEKIHVEVNGNDLHVIFTPIPEEKRNGKLTQHVIFFQSKNMAEPKNITFNVTTLDPDGTEYILKNMSYAEGYGFKIAAVNSAGMCKGWQTLKLYFKYPASATTVPPCVPASTTTPLVQTTTSEPKEKTTATSEPKETTTTKSEPKETTKPQSTDQPTEPTPVGPLARTADSNWLVYVLIALAVIVAIMGITIFLLIWQLYKNHRIYNLRNENYRMQNAAPNMGTDNEAQDNAV